MKKTFYSHLILVLIAYNAFGQSNYYDVTVGDGYGLRFWGGSEYFKIHFGNTNEYHFGPVTDYSIKMNMSSEAGRGWTWGFPGSTPVAALGNQGNMQISGGFTVGGDIILPSVNGNKQIYTWSPGDANWRIGMSPTPGFTTSMATSHVQYLSYSNSPGQGFAVGVNGGQSSFEITGSNHNVFFRGNVGIGITSPQSILHISNTGNNLLKIQSTTGGLGNTAGIDFCTYSTTTSRVARIEAVDKGSFNGDLVFYTDGDGVDNSNTTEKMRITLDGNIGIGLTTPGTQTKLHVYEPGSSASSWKGRIASSGGTSAVVMGELYGKATIGGHNAALSAWSDLVFQPGGGNVGIGTTSPDAKLTVSGQVHAQEVKVTVSAPGPDYVFDKDYKLTSLEGIKNYIDQNKHLPEVPSAKEMEKNGVQLGEMNMLLLKKIEELTLYVIEIKNENKVLKSRIELIEDKK